MLVMSESTFAEWAWKDVLKESCMQQIAHLLLRQSLLDQQAKNYAVAKLPKRLEEFSFCIRILHNVRQMRLIVAEDAW